MRKRTIYESVTPNEWEPYSWKDQIIQCCDCGLVHVFSFRVRAGKLEGKVVRDNRRTGQVRRHANIRVVQKRKSKK